VEIEKQGLFWSVLADMIRGHVAQLLQGGRLRLPVYRHIVVGLTVWFSKKALLWDERQGLACQSALNIDPLTASNFDPPFFVVTGVVPVVHRRDPRCFV
jgi:hypothetical protein